MSMASTHTPIGSRPSYGACGLIGHEAGPAPQAVGALGRGRQGGRLAVAGAQQGEVGEGPHQARPAPGRGSRV